MAKISKKNTLTVKGVVNINENKISFEVEDIPEEVQLSILMENFDGQEVTLTVNQTEEIA